MSAIPQGRHRTRARVGTALVVAGLVSVAACSSSSKSSSSSSATATTAAATATTAGSTATTAAAAPSTSQTITVTEIGPFSGPFASSSVAVQKGFEYVFDQVNAGTGLISAPGFTFKLVVADDGNVPSKALDLARTALSNGSHILNLLGHAEVDAVSPLTNSGQLLGTDEDPPDVSADPSKYPYTFDYFSNDNLGIQAQLKLASTKGLKKMAILAGAGDQYQGYVDDVNKYISADDPGASVVLTQRFDPNTSDFSSIVTKVQQAGADSVWFFATGPTVQDFYQAMIAASNNDPIFNAFGSLTCAGCFTLSPKFLSHVYLADEAPGTLDASGNPAIPAYGTATQTLWQHYNATSLTDKATLSAYLEDIAYGIVWSVKTAGSDNPAKLKAVYEATAASGGVSFISPQIKYAWSSTDHDGFPPSEVVPVTFSFNVKWPFFFPQAS